MAKKRKTRKTINRSFGRKNVLIGFFLAVLAFLTLLYFKNPNPSFITTLNNQSANNNQENISVEIVNGDLVVNKNGDKTQITNWGYNSDPVLSPNGSKIAYLSKTEETIEDEKHDEKSFHEKASSNNVWIINSDGSNPKKVTNHINFVYRGNLHWLDDNRLLFTDGVQSARIYLVSNGITQSVLGPAEPEAACLDACGFDVSFFLSPDKTYFVKIFSASNPERYSAVLNIDTLEARSIKYPYDPGYTYGVSKASFPNNTTMTFEQSIAFNDPRNPKTIQFSLDLPTGVITASN